MASLLHSGSMMRGTFAGLIVGTLLNPVGVFAQSSSAAGTYSALTLSRVSNDSLRRAALREIEQIVRTEQLSLQGTATNASQQSWPKRHPVITGRLLAQTSELS